MVACALFAVRTAVCPGAHGAPYKLCFRYGETTMKTASIRASRTLLVLLLGLLLAACNEPETAQKSLAPVAFHDSDECHVCGMIITDFPGPKGQALDKAAVKKFCSAAEMLGWWLQPENRIGGAKLYVHDMGRSEWLKPDDSHLIDASSACPCGCVNRKGTLTHAGWGAARGDSTSRATTTLEVMMSFSTITDSRMACHAARGRAAGPKKPASTLGSSQPSMMEVSTTLRSRPRVPRSAEASRISGRARRKICSSGLASRIMGKPMNSSTGTTRRLAATRCSASSIGAWN